MDYQQQTSRLLRSSIKPDCLDHYARSRRKPRDGHLRLLRDAGAPRIRIKTASINASNAGRRIARASGRNLQCDDVTLILRS